MSFRSLSKTGLEDLLKVVIKDALRDSGWGDFQQEVCIDVPKDRHFGDFCTNIALRLSRLSKKGVSCGQSAVVAQKKASVPGEDIYSKATTAQEIAVGLIQNINSRLSRLAIKDDIKEIKAEAGFINFFLKDSYFYKVAYGILRRRQHFGKENIGRKKRVLLEFVSANPTGPLSIAHARQAVVGDVLANVLCDLGFLVRREYYLNDEGRQIDLLGESIRVRMRQLQGEEIEFPQEGYQGEYVLDIAKELKESLFIGRQERSEVKNFSDYGLRFILKGIKKDLEDFGVKFDSWYSQKYLRKSGRINKALKILKRRNLVFEKEGAVWFRSTKFGDDKDRVVIKKEGAYTYLAPDIAYHREKYNRGFDWLINIWGPDHHGYISRLRAAVEALGKRKESLCIIIIQLSTIFKEGKPLAMSTRQGQYITLRQILDEVGRDAARFFFLMRRTSSHLDFDLELAKKHTPQNPVYYVQYAHARICSILRNAGCTRGSYLKANLGLLKQEEEIRLLKTLAQFPHILRVIMQTLDPYNLTVYLQNLATDFHKFYDSHRVLGQCKELTLARLSLIKAVQLVFKKGLALLGISAPEQM
jgi:arginyl-tRNA synthetase